MDPLQSEESEDAPQSVTPQQSCETSQILRGIENQALAMTNLEQRIGDKMENFMKKVDEKINKSNPNNQSVGPNLAVQHGRQPPPREEVTRCSIRLEEYDLDDFSPGEKNGITTIFKSKASATLGVAAAEKKIWITLQKGSLVILGETADPGNNNRWPNEAEAREIVQAVVRERSRPTEPQRVEDGIVPPPARPAQGSSSTISQWRSTNEGINNEARQPMIQGAQEHSAMFGPEGQAQRDGQTPHHQERRLLLITEKNLNMQKLSGEQDKGKNQVRYTKWKTQITDFVESKGKASRNLSDAMEWARAKGRDVTITDQMIEEH